MLKVLLVDDEPFIRRGLSVIIDWEAEGFHIEDEAADGYEALEKIKAHKYDLIIADIRMPKMSGLELLGEIRQQNLSDAHFVIISGYHEFSYAKMAIEYGCRGFIVKPVDRDELLSLLHSISDECEKSKIREAKESLRDRALFDRHITSVILGKYDAINLNYLKNNFRASTRMRYINFELDQTDPELQKHSETEKRGIQRALYERMLNILGDDAYHVIFDVNKYEDCYGVGFIYCDYLADAQGVDEKQYLQYLSDKVNKDFGYHVSISAGCKVSSFEELSTSYKSSAIAKFMQDFSEDDIVFADSVYSDGEQSDCGETKRLDDALVAAVESNDAQKIEQSVSALYTALSESGSDYRMIRLNMNYVMFQLMHLAISRDPNIDQKEVVSFIINNCFDTQVSRGSMSHFLQFCNEYASYVDQITSDNTGSVLARIEKDIAENYTENISLRSLSEKYFINSAYLGQLFRRKHGCSFKEHINRLRITRASELLMRTDKKVYEISEEVGYQSVDYFINKFVALQGHTPTQFRKKHNQN